MHVHTYGATVRSSSVGYHPRKTNSIFVNNRVKEINKLTGSHQWRYCPTETNPADILSRGLSYDKFRDNSLWMHGPAWLTNDEKWPIWTTADCTSTPTNETAERQVSSMTIANITTDDKPKGIARVFDLERFNLYKKLLRVTAYVLRFISNYRYQKKTGSLSITAINVAALKWIRSTQQTSSLIFIDVYRTKFPRSLILQDS